MFYFVYCKLTGMQKQMEQDKKKFGQIAWATTTPSLERLKLMFYVLFS